MSLENCKFHLRGHCKNTSSCNSNHDIKVCPQNQFCNQRASCEFRHIKICPKFPNCGFQNTKGVFIPFKKCSYHHPPLRAPYLPHPHHHPYLPSIPGPFIPADPVTTPRVNHLENLVQRFSIDLAAMGTELTTVKNLINKKAGDNSEVQSFSDGTVSGWTTS